MKFLTSSADLLAQLTRVSRVASTRSAVQALTGVQVVADTSGVQLRATDMDVAIRVPLTATVQRAGTIVLPARLLLDIVKSLPGKEVTIELRAAEQDVEVLSGTATFHIRTLRAEDFPPLPDPGEDPVLMPAAAFVTTINHVARSASRDETRPILTGILVTAAGSELTMVATDSYRLSLKTTLLDSPLTGSLEATIPAHALTELAHIAQGKGEGDLLKVSVTNHQVVFELGGVVLSSRLIDGQYPNYRALLPAAFEHEMTVASDEIAKVARRISLMAQRNAPVRLAFTTGELTISAVTPDVGEASQSLPVPFAGEPLEIGFNPDFLRDGLESTDGDLVLKIISPLRPGLITSADGAGFVYLIMPIRLNV